MTNNYEGEAHLKKLRKKHKIPSWVPRKADIHLPLWPKESSSAADKMQRFYTDARMRGVWEEVQRRLPVPHLWTEFGACALRVIFLSVEDDTLRMSAGRARSSVKPAATSVSHSSSSAIATARRPRCTRSEAHMPSTPMRRNSGKGRKRQTVVANACNLALSSHSSRNLNRLGQIWSTESDSNLREGHARGRKGTPAPIVALCKRLI